MVLTSIRASTRMYRFGMERQRGVRKSYHAPVLSTRIVPGCIYTFIDRSFPDSAHLRAHGVSRWKSTGRFSTEYLPGRSDWVIELAAVGGIIVWYVRADRGLGFACSLIGGFELIIVPMIQNLMVIQPHSPALSNTSNYYS